MDSLAIPWCSWCRLCAKEDAKNNVNIQLRANHQPLSAGEDVKLTLKEALEKYFWVQSSCEDLLPKHLCLDCYSLISSIMIFNERVERVQQMYKFLLENPMYDSCDLKSVRIKFDVCDENREYWSHSQNETAEFASENNQNTKGDNKAEGFTVRIKQENCVIESNLSEDDTLNDVDNKSIDQEEVLYDEHIVNDSQEDEDPFDETPQDYEHKSDLSSVEDEERMERKCKTIIRTSTRNKNNIDTNTVRTSKHKRKRRNLSDIHCKKKKKTTEDFFLDVACTECGQKFDLYSTYCEHLKVSHGNSSMDTHCKCPLCDRTLQTWYNFERHMRIHMPLESRKTIKCPECDNRYTSSAQLDAHINYKHRNEKPFICEECGICVRTNSNLRQHMLIHTDNAPFECEVCKKKFKNKSRLKIHMDIHSPNKHVCAICGLQLNSRATLNRHFLVHSDKMQHKCDYCGRAFKRAKALKNHLILHTGLKPYSCDFCDRTFANGSNCRSHMKKMHPDELASLEASGNKTHTKNIPKLETLKAVTKAADNLTPVVTKFSGCFAFGKKSKASTEMETPRSSKYLQKQKKTNALHTMERSTSPLDLQNIPVASNATIISGAPITPATVIHETIINSSSPTSIPNFDNIYQHLMKHNPNEMHIKRPPSSSAQSSPVNIDTSLTPQHNPFYSQMHQTNIMGSSAMTVVSQASVDLLHSPESHNSAMTPLSTVDDASSPHYGSLRQAQPLPRGSFM